ncbi:MAG: hypothetical protein JWM07_676, partial [Candidatus Saccharibacteria bacterium]|nr:hypothetical protein [Candidatus Saccharibacteria bacterium]
EVFMLKFIKEKILGSAITGRIGAKKIAKISVASVASLALVLQLTAGVFPFASTNVQALGDDNIVRNGVTSKEQMLAVYDSGTDGAGHNDIQQIYSHFGVSRQDIANATVGSYKTNDFNGQLKTIGRSNFPNAGRTAVAVEGASTTIYTGPFLDNAGNNANSTPYPMPALIGKRSIDGQWFAITLNCGNIVYAVTPPALPKPVAATCTSMTATRTSRTNFKFETKYNVGSDTFKSVTYVISDATGKEIARTNNATYTQATAGTYTVKAIVNVTDAAGKAKTISSDDCQAQFTVLPSGTGTSTSPKKCTVPGKENLSETSPDCKVVEKCTFTGKENIPATSPACVETPVVTEKCTVPGKTSLEADSPDCVEDVVTPAPTTLPKTGLGEDILKVAGLGSLIASVGYYVASRRGLLSALTNR